ncbi:MAG: hypothetical protein IAI50_12205, partial [Candidatus Eremiobacteraeota bacterium]|nr:hypothetical protein [Candidatus Eremiobacteraeota bacterium]
VALAAAARAGDAIAGVVAGGCTWTMTGAAGALARASDLPVAALTKLVGPARMLAFAETLVPRVTDAPTARAIVAAGLRLEARGESLRELAGFDLVAIVREIRVPIAFVNGRYDWPTRAGEGGLLRAARDASLVIAPRCGHGVGILDPQTFARALDLISRLERRRSNETDEA